MVKRGRKTGVYFQKVRVWVGKGQSRFAFRVYSVAAVAALRHTLGVCQNFPYANFLHVSRRRRGAYSRVYSRWACKREYTPKCLGWPRYFGVASTTRRRAGGASDYMRTRPGSRKSIRSSSARAYSRGGAKRGLERVVLAGAREGSATICARAPDHAKVYAQAARGYTREGARKRGLGE